MDFDAGKLRDIMERRGYSVDALAKAIGKTRQGMYHILSRGTMKMADMTKICQVLQVEAKWFATPLPLDVVTNNDMTDVTKSHGNVIYIPLIAYGGFLKGYANRVYMDTLERFTLPGVIGEHYAFEIDGMSMYDLASPGDFAIARPEERLEYMVKGKPYVLQTIDGILIKIFDHIKDDRAYFHSHNKEYNSIDLPLKSIKRVYFVTRILKKI